LLGLDPVPTLTVFLEREFEFEDSKTAVYVCWLRSEGEESLSDHAFDTTADIS
jgi:hypothetical protein